MALPVSFEWSAVEISGLKIPEKKINSIENIFPCKRALQTAGVFPKLFLILETGLGERTFLTPSHGLSLSKFSFACTTATVYTQSFGKTSRNFLTMQPTD
jgi:hypothetical protein